MLKTRVVDAVLPGIHKPTAYGDSQPHPVPVKLAVIEADVAGLADVATELPHNSNVKNIKSLQRNLQSSSNDETVKMRGGIASLKEAADLLDRGWPEGSEKALDMARDLEDLCPPAATRKRVMRWREQGDELDADRLLAGQLDQAWRSTERRVKIGTNTVLTVACSWGVNGSIPPDQLFWSGAAALALTELLENAGYSIDLWAIDTVAWWKWDRFAVSAVQIKAPGETVRAGAIAALLSHPGIYRTLGLAATAQVPWDVGTGFGSAIDIDEILTAMLDSDAIEHPDVVIPKMKNEEQAVAFLRKTITDINRAAVHSLDAEGEEGVEAVY